MTLPVPDFVTVDGQKKHRRFKNFWGRQISGKQKNFLLKTRWGGGGGTLPLFTVAAHCAINTGWIIIIYSAAYNNTILHYYTTTLLHYYTITLLHYYTITLLHYYTITLLHYYTITLLHYYTITLLHYYTTTHNNGRTKRKSESLQTSTDCCSRRIHLFDFHIMRKNMHHRLS
jgi:hypothetical protein